MRGGQQRTLEKAKKEAQRVFKLKWRKEDRAPDPREQLSKPVRTEDPQFDVSSIFPSQGEGGNGNGEAELRFLPEVQGLDPDVLGKDWFKLDATQQLDCVLWAVANLANTQVTPQDAPRSQAWMLRAFARSCQAGMRWVLEQIPKTSAKQLEREQRMRDTGAPVVQHITAILENIGFVPDEDAVLLARAEEPAVQP